VINLSVSPRRPLLVVDATTDDVTVTLPDTSNSVPFVAVERTDASGNTVTVVDASAATITTVDASSSAMFGAKAGTWVFLSSSSGGSGITQLTGDVTAGPGSGSVAATLATAQPAVHTWALAQTFTVAPVFTNQSGTRTALGATTVGGNLFTAANPGAITFIRANADNSVSFLDAATFRTAIGAGTGSGTVTAVSIATANGFSGSSSGGATPALTIVAGAITPSSVAASGTVTGSNLSGSNTGDQTTSGTANQVAVATGTTNPVISLAGPHDFTTQTSRGVLIGAGTSAIVATSAGTAGRVLTSFGSGADPNWQVACPPNLLVNGGWATWQRDPTLAGLTNADDTYCADRWYALTQTTSVTTTRDTGALGAPYAGKITNGVTSQRYGVAQILESVDSIPYRGRDITFSCKMKKPSGAANMRLAILEWTGTADAVTSDVVLSWTSGTYTAGNFFLAANLTVVGTTSTSVGTSFTTASVSGGVSSSCNNLIVVAWVEGAEASAHFIITECDLYDGLTTNREWIPRAYSQELAMCQRYCLVLNSQPIGVALNANNMYSRGLFAHPSMRTTPTLGTVPAAAFSVNAGSAGTVQLVSPTPQASSFNNPSANWTVGALVSVTAALEAEL
jgi:hypothetical protein